MNFFVGLYGYEIVMLVLGVLLFLVALIKLFRGKADVALVAFFLISMTMIGYPSVQSIEYKDGLITIKKKVHDLEANPGDEALRASLQRDIGKVEGRPNDTPEAIVTIAQAHFALGNEAGAKAGLDTALQKNPDLPAARELNEKIQLSQKLKMLTAQVEASPGDVTAKAQLTQVVSQVAKTGVANPAVLETTKHAQSVLKMQVAPKP